MNQAASCPTKITAWQTTGNTAGGEMKIISFIERDQRPVIERILRGHQSGAMVGGLWEGPIRTLANPRGPPSSSKRDPDEPRELQLVLDPEFL